MRNSSLTTAVIYHVHCLLNLASFSALRCKVTAKQNLFLSDPGIPGVRSMGPSVSNSLYLCEVLQAIQVMQVIQVIQVMQVVQVMQVMQVIQVIQVIHVIQVIESIQRR